MAKYKYANGFNRERVMAKIRAGNNGKKAVNGISDCVYLTEDGNKCAIGCFLPELPGIQSYKGTVRALIHEFQDFNLRALMPFHDTGALMLFQSAHDNYYGEFNRTLHEHLEDWLVENVEDCA